MLHQRKFIGEVLKRFHIQDCKPAETPVEGNLKLTKVEKEKYDDVTLFKQVVGSKVYL